MKAFKPICFVLFCTAFAAVAYGQPGEPPTGSAAIEVREATGKFHREIIRAAIKARKAGAIKRGDVVKLRVAMLSPAFRKRAEDLAVLQMTASEVGADAIPLTDDGSVDRPRIDWEAFAAFLEKLLPLILQLIEALSVNDVWQAEFLIACIDSVFAEFEVTI